MEKDKKLLSELLSTLHVGDKVSAMVLSAESEQGNPVLSLRRQLMDKNWGELLDKKEKGEQVEAVGVELTRGGLLVDVLGLRGFIPLSHLDQSVSPESLVGVKLSAKVLDLERKERRLVLSQKSSRVDNKKLKTLLDKLEIGKEYEGTVTGVTNFGIFVKLPIKDEEPARNARASDAGGDGAEGFVHISEISWEKVDDLGKMFHMGDKISVMVIGIDKENLKLNLSLKQLSKDPWEEAAPNYVKDQAVTGKINKVSSFGLFVSLESGVEGLIHKTKLAPDAEFSVGDKVECVVESVDREKRRIALVPLLKAKPVGYR